MYIAQPSQILVEMELLYWASAKHGLLIFSELISLFLSFFLTVTSLQQILDRHGLLFWLMQGALAKVNICLQMWHTWYISFWITKVFSLLFYWSTKDPRKVGARKLNIEAISIFYMYINQVKKNGGLLWIAYPCTPFLLVYPLPMGTIDKVETNLLYMKISFRPRE